MSSLTDLLQIQIIIHICLFCWHSMRGAFACHVFPKHEKIDFHVFLLHLPTVVTDCLLCLSTAGTNCLSSLSYSRRDCLSAISVHCRFRLSAMSIYCQDKGCLHWYYTVSQTVRAKYICTYVYCHLCSDSIEVRWRIMTILSTYVIATVIFTATWTETMQSCNVSFTASTDARQYYADTMHCIQ